MTNHVMPVIYRTIREKLREMQVELGEIGREVIIRPCSYDPSFEEIEMPEDKPVPLEHMSVRTEPLGLLEFQTHFDADGRLVNEHGLRKAVFKGGIDVKIRQKAWKFLFGLYPFQSTSKERELIQLEHACKYRALKARWKGLLSETEAYRIDQDDNNLLLPDYISSTHLTEPQAVLQSNEDDLPNISEEAKQQTEYYDIQAQVFAGRQSAIGGENFRKVIRIIDKDVPRTDRDHLYYRGEENVHLNTLRDILITFAVFHPEVNYAQGMNDILSRFLVVLDCEVEAYWCFARYMEQVITDFLETGMLRKLKLLKELLIELDTGLYQHLEQECEVGDLMFCHRWLLLCFKREFAFEDGLLLFEIVSSHHLELSSMEAETERERERARDFAQAAGGKERTREVSTFNTDFTFELFVCAAVLKDNRRLLFNCNDPAEVFECMNSLPAKMSVADILCKAEDLFLSYCRKSALECFQLVDLPPATGDKTQPTNNSDS